MDASFQLPHDFNHGFGDGMMPDRFGLGPAGYLQEKGLIGPPARTYPDTNGGFYSTICLQRELRVRHPIGESCHPNNGEYALSYFSPGFPECSAHAGVRLRAS